MLFIVLGVFCHNRYNIWPIFQNVYVGHTVTIFCNSSTQPIWLRYNIQLKPDDRIVFSSRILKIYDIKLTENGEYYCQGKNFNGKTFKKKSMLFVSSEFVLKML